jgi:hypothetical protein
MINLKQYVFLIRLELVGTAAQEQMKPRNENKKNDQLVIGELHISNCRSTVEIREYDHWEICWASLKEGGSIKV